MTTPASIDDETGVNMSQNSMANGTAEDNQPELGPRRSGRARKPTNYDGKEDELATSSTTELANLLPTRRNPKRKAAEAEVEYSELPDDLMDGSLAPLREAEQQDWANWIELESEPDFFNGILRDLGVKDVKIQEVFSLDEGSLAFLPKPVHGLIFLYQYIDEDQGEDDDEPENNVWFANQTTDNACATVALLNIIMNAEGVELGDTLSSFKAESADLDSPSRGSLLSNNTAIRTVHNAFSRRLDHLNAALNLENTVTEYNKSRRGKASGSRKKKANKKVESEAAFHFIAYVPVAGNVFQLDGLELQPRCIGSFDDDWLAVARPSIEARMFQYEESQLSFNLLALCQSPLLELRREVLQALAKMRALDRLMESNPAWTPLLAATLAGGEQQSAGFTDEDIQQCDAPAPFLAKISNGAMSLEEATATAQDLQTEEKQARSEYRSELLSVEEGLNRVVGRKRDHATAIHTWVRNLVECGELKAIQELI